jgi:hypothetical protein
MRRPLALVLALVAAQALWADLTIRYSIDLQMGPMIPPALAGTVRQQLLGVLPPEMSLRAKGGKCVSAFGALSSIIDSSKGEITLLNPDSKQFATIPAASLAETVAAAQPPIPADAQQALANLKVDVKTSKTGQTAAIDGIQTEESLVTIAIEIPGLPVGFRMEMHEWKPVAAELDRVPALGDMAGCSALSGSSFDPSAMLQKVLGQTPGAADQLSSVMKALTDAKGPPALRTQVLLFAPGLAAALQAEGGPAADASAPMMQPPLIQMDMKLAELSLNPLPDSAFEVPAGYREAPVEDLLKTLPGAGHAGPPPR